MGRVLEIINIPSKPIPEGFKIQVLVNQGYILDQLQHAKGNKKGPVDLNKSFLNKGFTKTQAVILDLLTQRHPDTNEYLYPLDKHIVWLDNLFSSIKLFKWLRSLGIGAAGTVRTIHTKQEEMGNKAIDINKDKNTKGQIKGKEKVPAKYFLVLLMDLKLSHDKQILWGMLYGELSKSYEVMEFAWKDAMVVLFLSIIYTGMLSCYSFP